MNTARAYHTEDPDVITLLTLIEATREIANIPELNGPAGRQLGAYVRAALAGRTFDQLTIGELRGICEKSGRDYNAAWHAAQAERATPSGAWCETATDLAHIEPAGC